MSKGKPAQARKNNPKRPSPRPTTDSKGNRTGR